MRRAWSPSPRGDVPPRDCPTCGPSAHGSHIDLINIYNTTGGVHTGGTEKNHRHQRRPAAPTEEGAPMATAVQQLMSSPPVTCDADATLSEATLLMDCLLYTSDAADEE